MKISIESARAGYLNQINTEVKTRRSAAPQETGRNFDQLMISSNSRRAAEEQLEAAAKKDVTAAVYQQTSEEKIAELKEQVAQGRYQVDPDAIAAKILYWGGQN